MAKPALSGEFGSAIPHELCDLPQWVLYRTQTRNGRTTKVPYQVAHASRRASSTDPATWGTYGAALAARQRGAGDGIGFVFSSDDPYAGIDFDHCLRNGVLDQHVRPIIARLDSYTECSPSGDGLHVVARAEVGGGRRTSKTPWGGELEVYDRGRYFTMTGQHLAGTPAVIGDRDEQVAALLAEWLPEPKPARPIPWTQAPARLDDRELLDRAFAASNGAKFRGLWQGDTTGYGSDSEADLALCSMLAFWTGPDAERIAWLFGQSGLMREKWDREDYRAATIAKALDGRTEFYEPPAPRLRIVPTVENALEVASAVICMEDSPLVAAREALDGRIVLERADGMRLAAPSLESLTTFAKLSGALAAGYGHELAVGQTEKTATAHKFVAALRRHFGSARVEVVEQTFEGWLVELVRLAGGVTFASGDAASRLRAWRTLDELDPEVERGARAFAAKVALALDTTTGDRYLRTGWAQEYVRRCGWRGSTEAAISMFEAVGLERPGRDGRVRAHWRAGGETLVLRFWVIPQEQFETWRADS